MDNKKLVIWNIITSTTIFVFVLLCGLLYVHFSFSSYGFTETRITELIGQNIVWILLSLVFFVVLLILYLIFYIMLIIIYWKNFGKEIPIAVIITHLLMFTPIVGAISSLANLCLYIYMLVGVWGISEKSSVVKKKEN